MWDCELALRGKPEDVDASLEGDVPACLLCEEELGDGMSGSLESAGNGVLVLVEAVEFPADVKSVGVSQRRKNLRHRLYNILVCDEVRCSKNRTKRDSASIKQLPTASTHLWFR